MECFSCCEVLCLFTKLKSHCCQQSKERENLSDFGTPRLITSTEEEVAAADKLVFTVQKLDTSLLIIFLWLFPSDTEQTEALAENKLSSPSTSMSNFHV